MYDYQAWVTCHLDDLWIFDKLILARKLGYLCGPADVAVPESNNYIVRPCVNLAGMSIGAEIRFLEKGKWDLESGYFWCEAFEGRHLSVDYAIDTKSRVIEQGETIEGFRNLANPLWKFDKWIRVKDKLKINFMLTKLKGSYEHINCEFIGGRLIEMHLRHNTEMGDYNEIIPVWKGDSVNPPKNYIYVEDNDYNRIGFFKR
jgi:hypothetical protein